MGGQRRPPAALPPGRPGTHRTGGWVGPRTGLYMCGKSHPPPGFDPRTVQSIASRYTGWAILAPIIMLYYIILCYFILYYIIVYYIIYCMFYYFTIYFMLYWIILYYFVSYFIILCHIMYYIILICIILYYIILYYIILYYIILYYYNSLRKLWWGGSMGFFFVVLV